MKVGDIMTRNVVCVNPETKITEVADILFRHNFHGVPVTDEGGLVVGVITENDFFARNSSNVFLPSYINFLKEVELVDELPEKKQNQMSKLLNVAAKDIMTTDRVTVYQDMDLDGLLDFFKKTRFTMFPVVDESEKIVGVVTANDLLGLIKKI